MSTAEKKVVAKTESPSPTTNKVTSLKFYRTTESAILPTFATKQSACFDLYANLVNGEEVQYYQAIATKVLPR